MQEVLRTPSLKACVREHGHDPVSVQVLALLTQADVALGGGSPKDSLALLVRLLMEDFYGVPVGLIIKGVRDGIRRATVGHKLTYPLLCSWIEEVRAQVEQHNYNEHMRLTKG